MRACRPNLIAVTLAVAVIVAACTAHAQRGPGDGRYEPPGRFGSERQQQGRNLPGQFDYYSLVLSWSPTYCASSDRSGYDPQCDRRDGRRYAFVLHGLWPQYEKGFPDFCPIRGRPFVPQPIIDGMLDIMPSPRLVIHEYKKHGTCSGLDPAGYYALSRRLFNTVKIPERYVNPFENQIISPDDIVADLMKVNPELRPDMLAIVCGGAGNRLREVRICFSKDGQPRTCGRNEDQRRLCSAQKVFLPPVRSSKQGLETPAERDANRRSEPLPGPRVIPSTRSD